MNSIAQQAVPNGIGQSEFDWAHWTSQSSFVVRKSAPDAGRDCPGRAAAAIFPAAIRTAAEEEESSSGTPDACEKRHEPGFYVRRTSLSLARTQVGTEAR